MKQQNLDEDGLASSCFMLTAFLPLLLYLTYTLLFGDASFRCECTMCSQKKRRISILKLFITLLVLTIVVYLFKNILTIKTTRKSTEFDPFLVLNVASDSSFAEIKKNYRKLLKVLNRKLVRKSTKEEAAEGIKNLNKAFAILKDPESLNKWMSEDVKKELIIAIPSLVVRFKSTFLAIYIALVAVCLPLLFWTRYTKLKKFSFSQSLYVSNEKFYNEIDSISEVPSIILNQLIFMIGKSEELESLRITSELPKNITETIENTYGVPVMCQTVGYLKLLAYLARMPLDSKDRENIRLCALRLVESFKKIALAKEKTEIFGQLLILEKMIHQAIVNPKYDRMQYPEITLSHIIHGIEKANTDSDDAFLRAVLEGNDLRAALNVKKSIPIIEIDDPKAYTVKTDVDECAFNDENIQDIKKDGNFFLVPKESLPYVQFTLRCDNFTPFCHTPYSQIAVRNKWYVYLKVNGEIQNDLLILDGFHGTKKVKMNIPSGNNRQSVKIFAVSNGYFKNDTQATLAIKYY